MKDYWSCTKIADSIRGTAKPESGSSRAWREWEKAAKEAHPIRYWIAETALDKIQNFIWWPIDTLYNYKYRFVNRFVTKTHALTASSLPKGAWHEFETRVLHCMFDELVNFVEIEQAWNFLGFSSEEFREKYKEPWYARGWFRTRTWRSAEAGLDYLDWSSQLRFDESWGVDKDNEMYGQLTPQAISAQEVRELYNWWKNIRPNRPDPSEVSGWDEMYSNRKKKYGDDCFWLEAETSDEKDFSRSVLLKLNDIEEAYHKEDEDMLIRLIKIRRNLWT